LSTEGIEIVCSTAPSSIAGLENVIVLEAIDFLGPEKIAVLLAEDHVKAVGGEWQIESAALNSNDRGSLGGHTSGDRKHRSVQVDAGDQRSTHSCCCQTRHNAGTASHIQNRFPSRG
jgi:hypothetical protein